MKEEEQGNLNIGKNVNIGNIGNNGNNVNNVNNVKNLSNQNPNPNPNPNPNLFLDPNFFSKKESPIIGP